MAEQSYRCVPKVFLCQLSQESRYNEIVPTADLVVIALSYYGIESIWMVSRMCVTTEECGEIEVSRVIRTYRL